MEGIDIRGCPRTPFLWLSWLWQTGETSENREFRENESKVVVLPIHTTLPGVLSFYCIPVTTVLSWDSTFGLVVSLMPHLLLLVFKQSFQHYSVWECCHFFCWDQSCLLRFSLYTLWPFIFFSSSEILLYSVAPTDLWFICFTSLPGKFPRIIINNYPFAAPLHLWKSLKGSYKSANFRSADWRSFLPFWNIDQKTAQLQKIKSKVL